MNSYLVKFITDYVVMYLNVIADDEQQAEKYGLQIVHQELGCQLETYFFEAELEGSYQ